MDSYAHSYAHIHAYAHYDANTDSYARAIGDADRNRPGAACA